VESEFVLEVEANLEKLAEIRAFVGNKAASLNAAPGVVPGALLAVTEVATNIMVHGYGEQGGTILIEVAREGSTLYIRLRDEAPLFDPTAVSEPDLSLPVDERPLGGMGLFLTRDYMDEVSYRVTSQGGNELTLAKQNAFTS
jgi:serine/threonine-protein kinase RsbW